MANFHLEVTTVSRNARYGKKSVTRLASYISGRKLYDSYSNRWYSHERSDVALYRVYVPPDAPADFSDLQALCDHIEAAEARKDARTAREFKGSLPNELPYHELLKIVDEFIETNFTRLGLPAVAAIHKGINNRDDSARDNPHVHIIVPTRTVDADGFSKKKFTPLNAREYIRIWRSRWAEVQNRAYERCRLEVRVSHKSLKEQNKEREPVKYIPRLEYVRDRDKFTAEREAAKADRAHAREQTHSAPEIERER